MNVDDSLLELYRAEVDTHMATLSDGLLALERGNQAAGQCEAMMRAAHSIKGAARIIGLQPAVDLSHVIEDCFVAVGRGELSMTSSLVDVLLEGVDLLQGVTQFRPAEGQAATSAATVVADYSERLRGRMSESRVGGSAPTTKSAATRPAAGPAGRRGDDVRRLDCPADIDVEWVAAHGAGLIADLRQGGRITLDLTGLRWLSTTGVAFLVALHRAANTGVPRGHLRLYRPPPLAQQFFLVNGIEFDAGPTPE